MLVATKLSAYASTTLETDASMSTESAKWSDRVASHLSRASHTRAVGAL